MAAIKLDLKHPDNSVFIGTLATVIASRSNNELITATSIEQRLRSLTTEEELYEVLEDYADVKDIFFQLLLDYLLIPKYIV